MGAGRPEKNTPCQHADSVTGQKSVDIRREPKGSSLHFSPRGEAKCVRGAVRTRRAPLGARRAYLNSDVRLSTASKRNEVMAVVSCASTVGW